MAWWWRGCVILPVMSQRYAAGEDLPPLPTPNSDPEERGRAVMARIVARSGRPTLEHYRRVYVQLGAEWPGDDEARRRHFVDTDPAT